jgi:hypothetical protein
VVGISGYAHESYVRSLSELGEPVYLERSGAWLLTRDIPGTNFRDGIGPYPFFEFENFDGLSADLRILKGQLVSVSLVTDPFWSPPREKLNEVFDLVRPFKTHYRADLDIPFSRYLRRHHRRYTRKAFSKLDVNLVDKIDDYFSEWVELYGFLVKRHELKGIQAFGPGSLARQLEVPGCYYFRATLGNSAVGVLVCYLSKGIAYAHLISTTPEGQELRAQYALYHYAMEFFRGRARWFALGSIPGTKDEHEGSGIAFFKSGWATSTHDAYFCGYIGNRLSYSELCNQFAHETSEFFPPYRNGFDNTGVGAA